MECLLQYLDDLDDLAGAVGLLAERLRELLLVSLSAILMFAGCGAGIALAQTHTPMALATVTLLLVTLLYRSATQRRVYRAAESRQIS